MLFGCIEVLSKRGGWWGFVVGIVLGSVIFLGIVFVVVVVLVVCVMVIFGGGWEVVILVICCGMNLFV